MKYRTKREAAESWVRDFDAIDTAIIRKLWRYEPDDWYELLEDEDEDTMLPMWGYMWQVHDPCDVYWILEESGIADLKACGFRVYESDEFGIFFGIDSCGYDFFQAHWIPLYERRGLRWHEEKEDD